MRWFIPLLILSSSSFAADFTFGDRLFKERRVETKARQALGVYRSLYEAYPEDADAAWRFAMACQFVGLRLTPEGDERTALYKEGRDAAVAASEHTPKCAPCHFWAGIDMALYGEAVGVVKMLFTLGSIQKHLKASAAIDPKYAHAGAYRVLGLIEQKLPGVLGGSNAQAKEYMEKAIATEPTNPLNYLFLARLYGKVLDDKKAAAMVAAKGRELPKPPEDDIESREAWDELVEFLPRDLAGK